MTDMIGADLRPQLSAILAPTGRHFMMLDDPTWLETPLETFVK